MKEHLRTRLAAFTRDLSPSLTNRVEEAASMVDHGLDVEQHADAVACAELRKRAHILRERAEHQAKQAQAHIAKAERLELKAKRLALAADRLQQLAGS